MNALRISVPLAIAYLRDRLASTLLNIVLLGLGIATIVAMQLTLARIESHAERDAAGVDLVVGAKGSPLQLVLSALYQVDIPTGNISQVEANRIAVATVVKRAVPVALGDSFQSFRIVGTTLAYRDLYDAKLAAGRDWARAFEVIIGAEVAAQTGLTLGTRFAGTHGLAEGSKHDGQPFEVVGILRPTGSVIDRLIMTGLESVWQIHAHAIETKHAEDESERQITALLVQYKSPLAAASFPREVNAIGSLQAATPAIELSRLFAVAGVGMNALKLFAAAMIVCAGLGIFIGLVSAFDERVADLALMRLLGADRITVFLTILCQGFALGMAGVILGLLLGHAGAAWIGSTLARAQHVGLGGPMWVESELWIGLIALSLATAAGAIPAWRAYRGAVPTLIGRD